MESKMVIVFGFVVAVFLQTAAAQTGHVVGDNIGWTIPQSGAQEYVTWAAIFNFATNAHDVLEVPKASFDSCSSENPIGTAITTGPANITLTSAGDHYYICTYSRHCQSGQKLAITVTAASPGAAPSVPPPPSTTNTPPTTPSPTSNGPAACEPVPAPSPSMSGVPTVYTTPGSLPPLGSSSHVVLASFVLSSLALVVGLFF